MCLDGGRGIGAAGCCGPCVYLGVFFVVVVGVLVSGIAGLRLFTVGTVV
jgi:hypothetical protein